MNLLIRHLHDLLIANVYSVTLIKKEVGMVKESVEFQTSSVECLESDPTVYNVVVLGP